MDLAPLNPYFPRHYFADGGTVLLWKFMTVDTDGKKTLARLPFRRCGVLLYRAKDAETN